ncbi:transketolase, partial [bacterium LRH843]|nr:transketolase [bacterium LRH843]
TDRAEFDRWTSGDAPKGADIWTQIAQEIPTGAARPTILSSGDVCDALAEPLPDTMVLCADLEAPTNHKRARDAFTATNRGGS